MKIPRVSCWKFLLSAILILALVLGIFNFLSHDQDEGNQTAHASVIIRKISSWLLDSSSRAWLVIGGASLAGLYLFGYVSLRKQIKEMELHLLSIQIEGGSSVLEPAPIGASADAAPAALPTVPATPIRHDQVEATINYPPIVPAEPRPKADQVREPADQLTKFLEATRRCKHLRDKPGLPNCPWMVGFACHGGNVRPQNQDYGFSFLLGGRQVLVLADGCGGIPHGQRAAYLAAVEAACSIAKTYGRGAVNWYSCDPQVVAQQAMLEASLRLAKEGQRLHLVSPEEGLRTTLIIVIGQGADVGYAYIGDGGGCIVRTNGEVEHFLEPQKASPDQLNVLAASLGPKIQGEPMVGTIQRSSGDLLLVGTDGVFDRVDDSFPKDVLRAAIRFNGDLATTAKLIVDELASKQDEVGFICDDNLTIGIMGDGSPPVLAAGFWNARALPALSIQS